MIEPALRQVVGGMLVQDRDIDLEERGRHAGRHRAPPDRGRVAASSSFAWKVCKHVKSNAIVICA